MAKCNLGKVNLESMRPAVFLKNMPAGWPQGFALPCVDESAVLAICYSFAIIVVLLQCFARKISYPAPSLPCWESVLGKYGVRQVFPLKFLQCDGAGWWPQAGLVPAHRVAMETSLLCLILARGPPPTFLGTSSQAHLLAMSLN